MSFGLGVMKTSYWFQVAGWRDEFEMLNEPRRGSM